MLASTDDPGERLVPALFRCRPVNNAYALFAFVDSDVTNRRDRVMTGFGGVVGACRQSLAKTIRSWPSGGARRRSRSCLPVNRSAPIGYTAGDSAGPGAGLAPSASGSEPGSLMGLTLPSHTPLNVWTPGPIEALADEAAEWVTGQIYARYAPVLMPFGARGRFQTRQDLRYHVEFLGAAVAVSAPVYFTDYVLWLNGVLRARGVPVQTLAELLHLLKAFFEGRLEPALLASAQDYLDAGLAALANDEQVSRPLYQARMPEPHAAACAFAGALLEGDAATARAIIEDIAGEGPGYVEIATHLVQPALYAIGGQWERNEITVAQEHLAAAVAQTLLVELFLEGPFEMPHGRKVLLAAVEHNQHVIGLRMLADAFELAGWSVQYLGANTPTGALLAQVDRTGPDRVALSVSLVPQLPTLRGCIAALRSEFGGRCPVILVGGIPTNQFEDIWRPIGADAWSPDAASALELTA